MRLIIGFFIVFIFAVIFSYFQGFLDLFTNLGVIPDEYRNVAHFDVIMIFVFYILLMGIGFMVFVIMLFGARYFDWKLNSKIKKAKKRAKEEYGMTAPYFYFLEPDIIAIEVNKDKNCYTYELIQGYLFEKFNDWDQVDKLTNNLSKYEYLKLYHEAIEYYGLPDIPKEYGIFNEYKDEEVAQFSK